MRPVERYSQFSAYRSLCIFRSWCSDSHCSGSCASCSIGKQSKSFAWEQSAAAADGLLERIPRKGSLQDTLDRGHTHLVVELGMMMAGAAWSNSRHTAPEAEVRQEEAHCEVHPEEGRDIGDTAHPEEEDQAVEDRDRWSPWVTQRSYLAPTSDQLAVGCPDLGVVRRTVDICHE
jgi:hypothetical protein